MVSAAIFFDPNGLSCGRVEPGHAGGLSLHGAGRQRSAPRGRDDNIGFDVSSWQGSHGDLHRSLTRGGFCAALCSGSAQFQACSCLSGRSCQLGQQRAAGRSRALGGRQQRRAPDRLSDEHIPWRRQWRLPLSSMFDHRACEDKQAR